MKLWSKRLSYCCAGLVLLFVVFVLVERFRGEWALSARLQALSAKGEKLSLAELKPKRPAPEQNALTELLARSIQIRAGFSNLDMAPPSLQLTSSGRAVLVAKLNQWTLDGKKTNDWPHFGSALEKERKTLDAIESATRKPAYDSGFDYEKGFVDYHFSYVQLLDVKKTCDLLSDSVLCALREGNKESAYKDLRVLVTLIARQTPEPLIISQMVRQRCASVAFGATWQALQSEGWNDAQLAALKDAWQSSDFVKDMASAMEMERALNLDFYVQIRDSKKKLDFANKERQRSQNINEGIYGMLPILGTMVNRLHLSVWQVAWAAQDELATLELCQFMIDRERLAHANGWSVMESKMDDPRIQWVSTLEDVADGSMYDLLRYMFTFPNKVSMTDDLIRGTLEIQTQQQMVIAALGIQRYRLKTGKLPPELSALVPEYMEKIPHDFMDGKGLRYRLLPGDNDFVLYSVGEDGKDDGGDPTLMKENEYKSARQFWDGCDAVWPAAATAEEAQLAMKRK